uniref:Uncharacterized protein n=1 Tax=Aegilops tauschii TaxID=37682 RepID=N1QVV5_AEGTA
MLRRLISAAAPAIFLNPSFDVEGYLVSTCGLSRAQAVNASAKLSHLKSPSKPDAMLAFLAGLGLSGADVVAFVTKDPLFLYVKVEKSLAPVVAGLTDLGQSRSDIAHLVSLSQRRLILGDKIELQIRSELRLGGGVREANGGGINCSIIESLGGIVISLRSISSKNWRCWRG